MSYYINMSSPWVAGHLIALPIFTLLAIIAVFLRFYARHIQGVSLTANDYLIVAALITNIGLVALTLAGTILVSETAKIMARCCLIIGPILWALSVLFIRASIGDWYLRLFPTRKFQWACKCVLVINILFSIAIIASQLAICQPISLAWARDPLRSDHCGNTKALELFTASFNLSLDITVIMLPMPVLWMLQLPMRKKIALMGMFSMGLAICLINVARISVGASLTSQDLQKRSYEICLLIALEGLLGVVSACMPVLKPVFSEVGLSQGWLRLSKTSVDVFSATVPSIMRRRWMRSAASSQDQKAVSQESMESQRTKSDDRHGEKAAHVVYVDVLR